MKKILIWNSFPLKERNGGPPTYLYNLKKGFKDISDPNISITFLDEIINLNQLENNTNRNAVIKRLIPKIVVNNLRLLLYIFRLRKSQYNFSSVDINNFDAIHFHLSIDLYKNVKLLRNYKGKVLLTSHSPQPSWIETIEETYKTPLSKTLLFIKKKIEKCDVFGFQHADLIVFPCEEALEPYLTWNKFKEIHTKLKYEYVLSGIPKASFEIDRETIRQQLKIPSDSIVISYIGRHTQVKGYDLLCQLGERILKDYPNVYFIIAGKEEPLKGINHSNWIEIGWTNDPHSYVNSSDIFILPNRQTYFDLVLLEVFSLGKPVVLSNTGGNNHFKKYRNIGIKYFDNNSLTSLYNEVKLLINKADSLPQMGHLNQDFFYSYFSNEAFATNYYNLYKRYIIDV